jgi:PEP-utilising enzyme, mobile domain
VDAAPPIRFAFNGGRARTRDLVDLVRHLLDTRPGPDVGLLAQRQLSCRLDGIAVRTAAGLIVVESQLARAGNFFRDGSTPARWIIAADGVVSGREALPAGVAPQLAEALHRIPVASCVEWVLTQEGTVQFVDAKPLPPAFLASFDPPRLDAGCIPVLCGTGTGALLPIGDGRRGDGPVVHVADRSTIDILGAVGPHSRGLVAHRGGVLSHAVVYTAQLGIPVVVCAGGHGRRPEPGAAVELTVTPAGHLLEPVAPDRSAGPGSPRRQEGSRR